MHVHPGGEGAVHLFVDELLAFDEVESLEAHDRVFLRLRTRLLSDVERRRRKLLVSRRELARLWNATQREGMTLVPLSMYFNGKGIAKLKLGIANGTMETDGELAYTVSDMRVGLFQDEAAA